MSTDFERARQLRPLQRMMEEDGRPIDRCPICSATAIVERSGRFSDAWVDRVAGAIDLERVASLLGVGGPNGLKKSGANWVGECPECKGDAFNVWAQKGIWKCFKCNKSGNSIGLVQLVENVEFPGAVQFLAKQASIPVEYENERCRIRCTTAGCAANTKPLDEVGYLMQTRNLSKAEACVQWLQEAGLKRGESHSPSLMLPGRRKGKLHEVINAANGQTTPPSEPESNQPSPADDPVAPPTPTETTEPDPTPAPTVPPTAPASEPKEIGAKPTPPRAASGILSMDESELPKAALRQFWSETHWSDEDAIRLWRTRGLTPHTCRVAGLRTNDRPNLEVLKGLQTRFPVDVLVEVGLWQRHEPDGPAWLQSESEAGVEVVSGARPSEFFYGKGQIGTVRKGREKIPQYGWNKAPIIPYWQAGPPDRGNDFTSPKGLITEGEFKALAVWQVHGVSPGQLSAMPDPDPNRLLALRPHKHWARGATPLPYLCRDGDLPLRVAALPGITFCRLRGGSWTVRYHLDEWLKLRGLREVMIAYDNDDRVSRWRCPQCGNTDVAISRAIHAQSESDSGDLFAGPRIPRGLRTGKPTCCGRPMKESPGFKEDDRDRWDAVLYALLLGQEMEKLGLDARFMLIPDEMRNRETGKADWDSSLASMLFETRQGGLAIEDATAAPPPAEEPDPEWEPDFDN